MKITLEKLKSLDPCIEGLKWYEKNIKTEDLKEVLLQLNGYCPEWSRWLMVRMLTKEQNQQLALFAAKLILPIYNKRCPNDKRVEECILAAEGYLRGRVGMSELVEKRSAAYAAYAAEATAAAEAAYAAEAITATVAAYAAATVAAAYATVAGAKKEAQEKIILEAIRLTEV